MSLATPMTPDAAWTKTLIEQGVLGVVLLLTICGLAWVTVQWSRTNKSWIADKQKLADATLAVTMSVKGAVDALTTSVNALRTSTDATAAGIVGVQKSVDDLRTTLLVGLMRQPSSPSFDPPEKK